MLFSLAFIIYQAVMPRGLLSRDLNVQECDATEAQ